MTSMFSRYSGWLTIWVLALHSSVLADDSSGTVTEEVRPTSESSAVPTNDVKIVEAANRNEALKTNKREGGEEIAPSSEPQNEAVPAPQSGINPEGTKASPPNESGKAVNVPVNPERKAAMEELRYRHLWIAYGAAWLLIFGLMFRTSRQNETTSNEIDALKKRLTRLEASGVTPPKTVGEESATPGDT